jgi:hypothetical protein
MDDLFSPSAARDEADSILSYSSSGRFQKLSLCFSILSRAEVYNHNAVLKEGFVLDSYPVIQV